MIDVALRTMFSLKTLVKTFQEDETVETISRVTFTPTKAEHNEVIQCQAVNEVMDQPIIAEAALDIMCKKIFLCSLKIF